MQALNEVLGSMYGVEVDQPRGESGEARRQREAQARRLEMAALAEMTADQAAAHLDRHCPYCGALLIPYEFFKGRYGFGIWRYRDRHHCPEETQALAAQDAAQSAENRRTLAARLERAGLTGELATATFDTFRARRDWRDALVVKQKALDWLAGLQAGQTNWLVLHGGYGLGKSHLAAALCRAVLEQGEHSAFFRVWPEWLQRLQLSWGQRHEPDAEKESDIVAEMSRGWLVALDDLDKVKSSDWMQSQLFMVLNRRLTDRLPTVITCNARPGPQLAAVIGKAATDRLMGRAVLVSFEGPSYRSGVQL